MSDIERHIPAGHRGPRKPLRSKAADKTTTRCLEIVQNHLFLVGPTSDVEMRRNIIAIDRQRYYRLRSRLVHTNSISLDGRPLVWSASRNLLAVTVGDLYGALEPRFGPSSTHPGKFQVDCPFCGLFKKAWPTKKAAASWYYETHLKTSGGHR